MCHISLYNVFNLNLMKKSWLAPGRVLARSKKNAFCQCHWTLLCLFEGKYETLELSSPF